MHVEFVKISLLALDSVILKFRHFSYWKVRFEFDSFSTGTHFREFVWEEEWQIFFFLRVKELLAFEIFLFNQRLFGLQKFK